MTKAVRWLGTVLGVLAAAPGALAEPAYRVEGPGGSLEAIARAVAIGQRVGYGLFGSVEPVEATDRIRQPFYLNHLAQTAAVAMLRRPEILDRRVASQLAARDELAAGLTARGFNVATPQANFVWVPLGDRTSEWGAGCEQRGVIVRAFAGSGARVTISTPEENDVFLAAAADLA